MLAEKPVWLKIRPPTTESFQDIKDMLSELNLNTVCQEAHCPNISECWSGGTATFMVMGDTCTRGCRFCAVKTSARPLPLDKNEPKKLADAVSRLKLGYIVITSVNRDDLNDEGSMHFAECIKEIKKAGPKIIVEVLIPDFNGKISLLKNIVDAEPDVIAHNIETVESLQRQIRDPRANYSQSLSVLENVKKLNKNIFTKSSIMLGLGETEEEIKKAMDDLREINVDILTLGQYLQPSKLHAKLKEYVTPKKFEELKKIGEEKGFMYVASGPFVRSSYRAGEFFVKNAKKNNS